MKRIKRPKLHASVVATAVFAVGILTAVTVAQTTQPSTPEEQAAPQIQVQAGTFEIHVQGADLRGVLQLLSTQGKINIIATKEVTGQVTADLYAVTFQEALEAILRSSGFRYERKGNFVYVYTPEQLVEAQKAERKIGLQIFQLAYLTAADARKLIIPAMSKDGKVSETPKTQAGIGTNSSDAGGNNYAYDDVLIVRDYEENLKEIGKMLKKLDVRPQQVLIEATILKATLTEDNDLGINFSTLSGIDLKALGIKIPTISTDFPTPGSGISFEVKTGKIKTLIDALETITDITILANPKLLVMNKQRGEIIIGRREGYITTTVTETAAIETVEFLETGTSLVFRPFIGRDGYIRLEIHPKDSSGSVKIKGDFALPEEDTTEATSNVLIRDGHTLVLGGLFREQTTNGRSQVPVMGDIPYIGALFRSTNDQIKREEVIVLITPHIIRHEEDEGASEQIKDDVERFRVGQRKGLRWWGRSRMAQTHMRWAKRALSVGNLAKALWNVDMVLSLSPRMIEAIHLKERLTNQAYWADESRASTTKYIIQQMMMQELGKPVERIIPPRRPRNAEDIDQDVRDAFGITKRYEDPVVAQGRDQFSFSAVKPSTQDDAPKSEPSPERTDAEMVQAEKQE